MKEEYNNILYRMKKAHKEKRGIHLSKADLDCLALTLIGEWWQSAEGNIAQPTVKAHVKSVSKMQPRIKNEEV